MIKLALAVFTTAAIAGALAIAAGASGAGPSKPSAISTPGASSLGISAASAYEPHLNPTDFSLVIDNPYFPLRWTNLGLPGDARRPIADRPGRP